MGSQAAAASSTPHAVCIPYPAQGHVIPMLNLAKLLHARGFHVTYVNTEYNARRLLRSRGAAALDGVDGFRFATIPDGLEPSGNDDDVTQDIPSLCRSTRDTCLPHLLRLIHELNSPPVTCIVTDGVMTFAIDAAKKLGLPVAVFWTASACSFMGYRSYEILIQQGTIPFKDASELTNGRLNDEVDGGLPGLIKNIRLRDIPSFIRTTDPDDFMLHYPIGETGRASLADAVILNSLTELEGDAFDAMADIIPRVIPLRPLPLLAGDVIPVRPEVAAIEVSLWREDEGCLRWLDGKKPGSVVYVNFGSVTVMTNKQLVEFAWGLAGSGYHFLWIIRPDLVRGDVAVLPPEWTVETADRGMTAGWCPQRAVLEHPAVAAFLTHSGWNSTLESIAAGVPMLSWPFFADQQTNCRYACTEWGLAMEIGAGGDVERSEVEGMIREVMDGEAKGKEMRAKAAEWKAKAAESARAAVGGLDRLINDVLLRRRDISG